MVLRSVLYMITRMYTYLMKFDHVIIQFIYSTILKYNERALSYYA